LVGTQTQWETCGTSNALVFKASRERKDGEAFAAAQAQMKVSGPGNCGGLTGKIEMFSRR
jgi:hypothetical protein